MPRMTLRWSVVSLLLALMACDDDTVTITVVIDPTGTGTGKVTGPAIDCPGKCVADIFTDEPSINLVAEADPGSVFSGWSGYCAGAGLSGLAVVQLDDDHRCVARFDASAGVLTPRGSISLTDLQVEAATLRNTVLWIAGFNLAQGHTIDVTDPDNLTSGVGAEFGSCLNARAMTYFFSPLPQYLQDVMHVTCTSGRGGSLTPSGGGFTALENYGYEPGEAALIPGTQDEAIVDFETGRVRRVDRDATPGADVLIPLTNPLERSCPFDITIWGTQGYVVGREGLAGTSTANCNNWIGLWRLDFSTNQVLGFTPFGTKLRDVSYLNNSIYVADFEEDKVHVLNSTTGAYDHAIDVGDGPTSVVLEDRAGPLSDRMYVTLWNSNEVQVIDLGTELEVDKLSSGGIAPVRAFLDGTTLIVLNFGETANNIGAVVKAFSVQ